MKQIKKLLLLFFLMSIWSGYALTDYCATARTSANPSGTYTLNYTCRNVSGTTYEMKLEFANTTGGNANANIASNPGGVNVAASPVWSNGNKTLTYQFTSSATPVLFVATVFVIINGSEVRWDLPTDANFAATCSGGGNPAPTFGTFTIPAKVVGNADFAITQPTTNSGGAITYSSGNTAVATISGSTIHIVGAGSSVITLNQAADATHAAGSTTATFTVTLANTTPTAGPTVPPARNAWDVFSQYGAAYTNQPGVAFFDFGGSTIVGDVTLGDGQVVKKYTNHNYSGIGANGALNLNVSAMTKMHIDVWSPDFVSFKIKLEAANGVSRELEVPAAKVQGVWNSYDLDLSTYSSAGGPDMSQLRYIVPVTTDAPGNRTLYITNVYFYRPATSLPPPTLGAFTVPAKNVGDADFALTAPTSNSAGAWTYTSGNTAVATITGNTVHIVGGGTSVITANQAATASFGAGTATASLVVSYPNPPAAPTQPARAAVNVISIFAGAYTDISGTNFNPGWGQSANYPSNMTTPSYGGDPVKRYENTGTYQGTNLPSHMDVSVINKLHVDIYSYTMTSLRISLINEGVSESAYAISLTPGVWNSFNIDVNATNFPGVDLTQISQIKYDQFKIGAAETGNQILIIDNLYFYKETATPPTLGAFTVPAKVLGDADFAITPPTSNSAGAFTYSSSNTAVATIVGGNSIHIVGAGTSTITANQAANGIYASASTTASFVVTVPPLATAAPTPPARNSFDVISLYSNAYATSSAPTWQNAAATTDEQLQGNDTKKMSNFLVEFINFTPTDLTPMMTLHMDVYSEDCTGMNIWLLNNGDRNAQISITPNQWNSIDIPLSTYINLGLNMNGVSLLKFESLNGGGKTVYVDNIYFYRPATLMPPTLSNFNIPAKAVGDADFALTAPTSNSPGAFTYTSSNIAVATVTGGTVHIVAGGTSTITATQAATTTFGSASITAPLVVAFAPPVASPIPPARPADRVISMYTGNPTTYANAITTVSAPWSGATMTEIPNGTNTALKLENFGYIGLTDQAEVRFNVTAMSNLHIDIYLNEALSTNPGLSRVNVYLLANGDYLYAASNLTAGWNSLSIPMSNFSAADLTQVWGLKLESINPATQVYLDNIYFSNECYTYYADADNDGFGDAAMAQVSCTGQPSGYVLDGTDCNDNDNTKHTTFPFYADADGDTFGAGSLVSACAVNGTTPPANYSVNNTDCNDADNTKHATFSFYVDADLDGFGSTTASVQCAVNATTAPAGYSVNNTDCNDNSNSIHQTFPFYVDADGDAYGAGSLVSVCTASGTVAPAGYSLNNTDCNDSNNAVHQTFQFYADADGDTYGAGSLTAVCAASGTVAPAGYSLNNTDCNDADNTVYQSGTFFVDADNDGYTTGATAVVCYGAATPSGYALTNIGIDCNDAVAAINPGHAEVLYNGVDDNCDGQLDEGHQITTSLLASDCNSTLASIGSLIGITTLAPGSIYTGYRIRATNGAQVQVIERNVPHFTMQEFPSYAYATTYTIDIQLQRNGVWLGYYGPTCQVSTPAILAQNGAGQISPSQCGIVLPKINTLIATTSLAGVTGYRFRVTNLTDIAGPNAVQTIDRTQNWFSLQMLTRYNYGTTYRIEVSVKSGTGAFGGFGSPCEVSSPPAPSLMNCGGVVASGTAYISATSLAGVTQYRFQITRQSDLASATIDRNTNFFIFNSVPAAVSSPGVLYAVRVAVYTAGTWSPFGDACEITSPGAAARFASSTETVTGAAFKATVYPNPFTADFNIDIVTPSQEKVQVKVYDMLGKLLESKELDAADVNATKVGAQFPSGVYSVIVTQGGIVKTQRVIKR